MKKNISILLTASILLAALISLAIPASANESKTNTFDMYSDAPTISTADDYIAFFNAVYIQKMEFAGKTITMLNDISLNDTSVIDWYSQDNAFKFVGNGSTKGEWFLGTFDGNGHTLEGVIVEGIFREWDDPLGVFPYVGDGGKICNLIVDGFYVCSANTNNITTTWGKAGVGGLIGHAKKNVTVDNCTLKNGTITCTDGTSVALGAIIGTWDAGVGSCELKITSCTVEDTVSVVAGTNSTAIMGGVIGYVHDNNATHGNSIDLSASIIAPANSKGTDAILKPFGKFKLGGNAEWKLKNNSTSFEKNIGMWADAGYTADWNSAVLTSGCYGDEAVVLDTYTVTWSVNGVDTTEIYRKGALPVFKGSTEKNMTDTSLFIFTGWSPTILPVTADVTYTAQYDEKVKVVVTWVVDGVTTTEYYVSGELPNYKGEVDKEQDDDYVYTFKGWDKKITAANEDITYTAQYETKAKYEITWVIDGEEIKEIYLEGAKPSFKGNVEKSADENYIYKFTGWDKEIVPASEDVVYTAQFEKTAKNPTNETEADTSEKSGCGSTISIGLVTVFAVGMAGAVVAQKKEN